MLLIKKGTIFCIVAFQIFSFFLNLPIFSMFDYDVESLKPLLSSQTSHDVDVAHDAYFSFCLFDQLPSELINAIFCLCDPRDCGLNYLIHHYEPHQKVVEGIVRAKISFLLEDFYKDYSKKNSPTGRACLINQVLQFQKNFPGLYKKCRLYLRDIDSLELYCSERHNESSSLKKLLKQYVDHVMAEAVRLQRKESSGEDLFLTKEADDFLAMHRLYLQHRHDMLTHWPITNLTKPLCWDLCSAGSSVGSVSSFVLNIVFLFFSTSSDFEYKVPCLIVGSANTLCSVAWMLFSARICKKSAVPDYCLKKRMGKALQGYLKKAIKKLELVPQECFAFSDFVGENAV